MVAAGEWAVLPIPAHVTSPVTVPGLVMCAVDDEAEVGVDGCDCWRGYNVMRSSSSMMILVQGTVKNLTSCLPHLV